MMKTFLTQQKLAVAALIAVTTILAVYFLFVVVKDNPAISDFVEGEHYNLIEKPRRIHGNRVEVMEFFSYGCIHCYNFDSELNDWVEANEQRIKFVRMPVVANESWRILGQNYFTMEKLGLLANYHHAFFREVHEVKRPFATLTQLASYFDGKGTTAADYKRAFSSKEVAKKVDLADKMSRRLQVASVPTIVVAGKYRVNVTRTVGTSRMLDVVDYLVDKELAANKASDGAN